MLLTACILAAISYVTCNSIFYHLHRKRTRVFCSMEDKSHLTLDVILDFASPERSAQDHTRRGPRVAHQRQRQISHEHTFLRPFPPPHGT